MFYRKIEKIITEHLLSSTDKILLVDGARQVGKSFTIRHIGENNFKNYVEVNMLSDLNGERLFENIGSIEEFYLQLSIAAKGNLGDASNTLVFLDEIQVYPKLLTILKFLRMEGKYTYIASGSMLGVALKKTVSIPMGSIRQIHMYPMDFEEFLLANGVPQDIIEKLRDCFENRKQIPQGVHEKILNLFRYYLLCGGLPDAVKAFVEKKNIPQMREIQNEIHQYYAIDASQYDEGDKLKIRTIYDGIPSQMENRKKRIVVKDVEGKKGTTFEKYKDAFDYLISSGISLAVNAVPTPVYPLVQGVEKNLIKLYLNDVGILSGILFGNQIKSILNDERSVNLGSLYETVVAQELKAHGFDLYYYDNRKKGEVDFLVSDNEHLSVLPIEVKSGRDYSIHAALDRFVNNEDYSVSRAIVFSNSGEIVVDGKTIYYPIYMCMFLEKDSAPTIEIESLGNIEWK